MRRHLCRITDLTKTHFGCYWKLLLHELKGRRFHLVLSWRVQYDFCGFQKAVGKESDVALGRSTVGKILKRVLGILEKYVCPVWIKLNITNSERSQSKRHFMQKFGIPGIIGCVDGTHIRITKPHIDPNLFYNRKGYFSINALIICDYQMMIKTVDARVLPRLFDLESKQITHLLFPIL
ncbi:uncharacterized protein LOC118755438 [Rhagoletis pomonella]|uniref:uncharacterized protein LOC118755438 n=1 Tax=Rhagoletis pomonella TaxID=28610 RepID=UPI00178516D5|nr:uncharacterized protein LOC118755438 [Rhagoletis pomonella]